MAARRFTATATATVALFFLFFSPISSLSEEFDARAMERSALLRLKPSLSDPAGLLRHWSADSTADHCSWAGVACDSRSRVAALNISAEGFPSFYCSLSAPFGRSCPDPGRRIAGELSPAFGRLSELTVLSLPFHDFSGEIPEEIWRLEKLQVLDLEGSSLRGTLPPRFPRGLRVLNLAYNRMEGEIPFSLSRCLGLETLDLSGNRLSGSIPGFLGAFPKLKRLYLSSNCFGSSIPEEIGAGCRSLEELDLSGNQLLGSIPSNLGNCTELRSLLLFANLLDGFIPPHIGRLGKLRALDVSRNSLSGPLPAELGNCLELSVLVITNQLDSSAGKEPSNYAVYDESNAFEGGISDSITTLPKLRVLWAPRATLEGEVPSNWGTCESLEMINLGQNLFSGEIPRAFDRCKNLKFLNLSSNRLIGCLSDGIPVPCMDVFDVSGNQLSGFIPRFSVKQCSSQFPFNDLSSAYFSFFAYKTCVQLSLPCCDHGSCLTVYHNFGNNNFTGPLPSLPVATNMLMNQTVYAIVADRNSISGSLDAILLGKCGSLKGLIINFRDNNISSDFTSEISVKCRSLMVLDVAGNHISGMIPPNLGLLDSLVALDLSRNWLRGQIPLSFDQLKSLKFLSLAENNITGSIPPGLSQLKSLEVLDLSSNSLTREIPCDLVEIRNLTILLLDNNKLSGSIPPATANAISLSLFNVSFNNLSGPLPFNASLMRCDCVRGNPLLQPCQMLSLSIIPSDLQRRRLDSQEYTDSTPPPGSSPSSSSNSGLSPIEIASIASASAIVSVILALIVLYLFTRKCAPKSPRQSFRGRGVNLFVDIGVPLTFESVARVTGSFNASNCIGSGGFGATYKAEISPGVLVAIKRLATGRFQGAQQFHAEINTLGRCKHPNLVTLIGYHISDADMFLIYNYLPGGNLERFIQERPKRPMNWRMFHKIALDIASALAFLHDGCVPRILHRDVKPSNILLDNECNAYLSDFGLARLLGNSETHATTGVAGTFGYVAPEYAMTCRVSDKADVYSYGVVLLELISEKKALDPSFSPYGNGFNIVNWACMLLQKGRDREFFVEGLWDLAPHDDLVEVLHLGVKCTVDSLTARPTMRQVVRRLKELRPPCY